MNIFVICLCLFFFFFVCAAVSAAAALCVSVWWGLLPRPQALQSGGGLRGVGVSQLRGHPSRPRPGLGVIHQCSAHPAGPVCPVEGRQSHRLDRRAHLLRGLLHSPETVWGEAKPRPLQCVAFNISTAKKNLSFCFFCVLHFCRSCVQNTQSLQSIFFFVLAAGSWNLVFGCKHKAKFDVDLDIWWRFCCSSLLHQSPGCKIKSYIRKKPNTRNQIINQKSSICIGKWAHCGILNRQFASLSYLLCLCHFPTETPDSVSIRPVNHTGPMVEGKEYQLLCDVQNIAPVQYLTLRWYRGQTEVYNHSFTDLTSSSPVQVSSILVVTPTKAENGAQYRCVAVLELGPEGPQPPPTVTSEPLNASVYCKLQSRSPYMSCAQIFVYVIFFFLFSQVPPTFLNPEPEVLYLLPGDEITLNCTATGNPVPMYSWQSSQPIQVGLENEAAITSNSLLPGTYICTASNTLQKKIKKFTLRPKNKGKRNCTMILSMLLSSKLCVLIVVFVWSHSGV